VPVEMLTGPVNGLTTHTIAPVAVAVGAEAVKDMPSTEIVPVAAGIDEMLTTPVEIETATGPEMLTVPVPNVTGTVLETDTVPETSAVPEKPALSATIGAVEEAAGMPVVVYRNPTSDTAAVPEIETLPTTAGIEDTDTTPVEIDTATGPLMETVPVPKVTGTVFETLTVPETSAGPSERIGFIDAPEMGPPEHGVERDRASDRESRRLPDRAGVGRHRHDHEHQECGHDELPQERLPLRAGRERGPDMREVSEGSA